MWAGKSQTDFHARSCTLEHSANSSVSGQVACGTHLGLLQPSIPIAFGLAFSSVNTGKTVSRRPVTCPIIHRACLEKQFLSVFLSYLLASHAVSLSVFTLAYHSQRPSWLTLPWAEDLTSKQA